MRKKAVEFVDAHDAVHIGNARSQAASSLDARMCWCSGNVRVRNGKGKGEKT